VAVLGLRNNTLFILLTVVAIILPLQPLENFIYDMKVELRQSFHSLETPIVVVDIDEKSLSEVGGWPWNRTQLTKLLNQIRDNNASIIGLNLLLPQTTEYLNDINLAQHVNSSNTVPAIAFDFYTSNKVGLLPNGLSINTNNTNKAKGWLGLYPSLRDNSTITGHLNVPIDEDGKIRRIPNLITAKQQTYPPLALAMLYKLTDGEHNIESWLSYTNKILNSKEIYIPFDFELNELTFIPAVDLLENRLNSNLIDGSLVVVGSSSAGLDGLIATPTEKQMPSVAIHAYLLNAALSNQWITDRDNDSVINILSISAWSLLVILLWQNIKLRWVIFGYVFITLTLISVNFTSFIFYDEQSEMANWLLGISIQFILITFVYYREQMKQSKAVETLFKSYVPDNIIQQLIQGDVESFDKGERKQVSILFADIVGFTAIAEQTEPDELTKIIRLIFNKLTEIVLKHNGTVDKYMGDSIMAFWGAPLEDTNHAQHAVNAAKEMVDSLEDIPYDFSIGVGVNSGEVVVGNMGSSFRHAYSVLGDPVNIAARLEQKTREFEHKLLIGQETANQIDDKTQWLGTTQLKGKKQCIDIFTLQ